MFAASPCCLLAVTLMCLLVAAAADGAATANRSPSPLDEEILAGFSLTLQGSYRINRYGPGDGSGASDESTDDGDTAEDLPGVPLEFGGGNRIVASESGTVSVYIVEQRTSLKTVRLSNLKLRFAPTSRKRPPTEAVLSGLEIEDSVTSVFQSTQTRRNFGTVGGGDPGETCFFSGFLHYPSPLSRTEDARHSDEIDRISARGRKTPTWRDLRAVEDGGTPDPRSIDQLTRHRDRLLEGQFFSEDCELSVTFAARQVDLVQLAAQLFRFSLLFNAKSIVEMRLLQAQAAHAQSASASARISLVCLASHAVMDLVEALVLLIIGYTNGFSLAIFVIGAAFKVLLVMVAHVMYMGNVVIGRCSAMHRAGATTEAIRTEAMRINRDVVACVTVASAVFSFVFFFWPPVVLLLLLAWTPQIMKDVWSGHGNSITYSHFIGTSICRLFLPLYLWGYSSNAFTVPIFDSLDTIPSLPVAVVAVVVVVTQVGLMALQRAHGPRCFVRLEWLPHVYNYYRAVPKALAEVDEESPEKVGRRDCVICMSEVHIDARGRVITPCDHLFHDKCLSQWLDVKLECPTCRAALPPFP